MPESAIAISEANPDPAAESTADIVDIVELAQMTSLGGGGIGLNGRVAAIRAGSPELERILLEIGFIEGARVEILHEGPFGRDPIAVRVDDMRVALRRKEAAAVLLHTGREVPRD